MVMAQLQEYSVKLFGADANYFASSVTSNTSEVSVTGFSAAITPSSASNKVLVMCSLFYQILEQLMLHI